MGEIEEKRGAFVRLRIAERGKGEIKKWAIE
jgi:hypothetical protein